MRTILAQLAPLPGRWCFRPLAATALRSMRWFDVQNLPYTEFVECTFLGENVQKRKEGTSS